MRDRILHKLFLHGILFTIVFVTATASGVGIDTGAHYLDTDGDVQSLFTTSVHAYGSDYYGNPPPITDPHYDSGHNVPHDLSALGVIFPYMFYGAQDFHGTYWTSPHLTGCTFQEASFHRSYIGFGTLEEANMHKANMSISHFMGVNMHDSDLTEADLSYSVVKTIVVSGVTSLADLSDADLSNAKLIATNLDGADLSNATLTNASMQGANLRGTNLEGAYFPGPTSALANVTSGDITGNPVELPFGWTLYNGYLVGRIANLSYAALPEAYLSGLNIQQANMTRADMRNATLRSTDFTGALFYETNLMGADLRYAEFVEADLTLANLQDTILAGTDFTGADISGVNFSGTSGWESAIWTDARYRYNMQPVFPRGWEDADLPIHAYTPEPGALLLALFGLALLPLWRRRR